MDLTESAADAEFRHEVKAFLGMHLPAHIRDQSFALRKHDKAELVQWHRILARRGWGVPAWPREHGGPGWSVVQQKIFEEESMVAGAPRYVPQINMIGPVLQRYGSAQQQAHFLPRLVTLEDWWCQGYSEPEAGSDLASLRTRARRQGDHFVVSGQKIWTSTAPWADWMFALVRTSDQGRPNQGISFLLVDMTSPGIHTDWIKGIDGGGTLGQVFLDEVKVPVDNLVHEENQGWTVAKYLLGFERSGQAAIGNCKFLLNLLKRIAFQGGTGAPTSVRTALRERIAAAEIELIAHEWTLMRMLSTDPQGAQFSMLKNKGAELQQLLAELLLECAGDRLASAVGELPVSADGRPLPTAAAIADAFLDLRKVSIFAGTTEVQKNIIAKALLS